METSKMKGIIVLKKLPSNLIDEAIIILKGNKKVQELKYIEKNKINLQEVAKEKDYIIKEAESVLYDYIRKIESKKSKLDIGMIIKSNKRIKRYSIVITVMFVLAILKIII